MQRIRFGIQKFPFLLGIPARHKLGRFSKMLRRSPVVKPDHGELAPHPSVGRGA